MIDGWTSVFRRELAGYFATPLGYLFLAIYLALSGALPFELGGFFEAGRASMDAFFAFQPWLLAFLAPAIAMRSWAEEFRQGSAELLLTLPVEPAGAVLGKFLASWAFLLLGVAMTAPFVITVYILGDPDLGAILAGYVGLALAAGCYLAVGACVSALTANQVSAFTLGAAAAVALTLPGLPILSAAGGAAGAVGAAALASLSILGHYQLFARGVIDARDVFYFLSLALLLLSVAAVAVNARRASV